MESAKQIQNALQELTENVSKDSGKGIKQAEEKEQREFHEKTANHITVLMQSKMLDFFENVAKENWPSVNDIDSDYKKTKHDVKEDLSQIDESEEHLQFQISTAQTYHQKLEEKIREYEGKAKSINEKKDKLVVAEEKQKQVLHNLEARGIPQQQNIQELFKQQSDTLAELAQKRSIVEKALATIQEEIAKLRKDCQETELLIHDLTNHIKGYKQKMIGVATRECQKNWIKTVYSNLTRCSGVEVVNIGGATITLKITSSVQKTVTAEVVLFFKLLSNGSCSLKGAETSQTDLDISEIVSHAVKVNDPVFLVSRCQHLIDNHAPLLDEVDALRHKYAIDYQHEEGIVRAILGSSGQIVCTLTIQDGYPHRGQIVLSSMEGLKEERNLQEIKPPKRNPKLTDWLVYLHEETSAL